LGAAGMDSGIGRRMDRSNEYTMRSPGSSSPHGTPKSARLSSVSGSRRCPPRFAVLDLGCRKGSRSVESSVERCRIFALDASERLPAEFRKRFLRRRPSTGGGRIRILSAALRPDRSVDLLFLLARKRSTGAGSTSARVCFCGRKRRGLPSRRVIARLVGVW
jgi:hypothetical protein